MPAETVLQHLAQVRATGSGKYLARCPARAKKALFGQPDLSEPCKAMQLLIDAASAFKNGENGIHTYKLIERLANIEDSIWKDYNFKQRDEDRRRITSRKIAGLLKRYKIKSCQIRIGTINKNGYHCEQIKNALKRYAQPITPIAPHKLNPTTLQAMDDAGSSDFNPLQKNNNCSGKKAPQAKADAGRRVV